MRYRVSVAATTFFVLILGGWQTPRAEVLISDPHTWTHVAAVGGAVIAMLGGMWLVLSRQGGGHHAFGPNQLKALGLVIFLPTLLIVTIVHDEFGASSLAALLGTVAGYVLSHHSSDPPKTPS